MKTYRVKSAAIPPVFPPFSIEDDGLGYLTFNIFEKIAVLVHGPIGEIIGCRVPTNKILIQPPGKKVWFGIKYEKNSSRDFLEHLRTSSLNGRVISEKREIYQHSHY